MADHSYHMNGVDHKDARDTADWTVSLKSNGYYYLQIFYWLFDGVVLHAMYSIIKVIACDKQGHPPLAQIPQQALVML
jgi:hypothetical protein